jgi:hypothetical protein
LSFNGELSGRGFNSGEPSSREFSKGEEARLIVLIKRIRGRTITGGLREDGGGDKGLKDDDYISSYIEGILEGV